MGRVRQTANQAALLAQLDGGDRLVRDAIVARYGRSDTRHRWAWQRSGGTADARVVDSLIARGILTERGERIRRKN